MKKIFALIFVLNAGILVNAQVPDSLNVVHWDALPAEYNPDTIYAISFTKMKLDSVPEKLREFKQLRYLDLSRNKLTEIPGYIAEFESLRYLNLDKNRIDIFPLTICQMDSLEYLIFSRNLFERVPDCIEYATELVYIDFYDCPIGYLPESFERLKKLKKVDFSGIRFAPSFQRKWISRMPDTEFVFEEPCECME